MMRPLLIALLGLVLAAPAHAETFATCNHFVNVIPTTLSSQGVYCLAQDVSTAITTGAAITVGANNVTLDCNGYKIGGLGGGPATEAIGIRIDTTGGGPGANFTVRNCSIRGFATGLYNFGAAAMLVEDNRFDQSRNRAIDLIYPSGFVLRRNLITDTGGAGATVAIGASGNGGEISDNIIRNTFSTDSSVLVIHGGNCAGCTVLRNRILGMSGTSATGMNFGSTGIHAKQTRVIGNTITLLTGTGTGVQGINALGLCKDNTVNGVFSPAVACSSQLGTLANP
ncbi:MAG TPA: right-handed parallel beta-helix repeat-containing protein [Lysobacter sp.]